MRNEVKFNDLPEKLKDKINRVCELDKEGSEAQPIRCIKGDNYTECIVQDGDAFGIFEHWNDSKDVTCHWIGKYQVEFLAKQLKRRGKVNESR